MRALVSWQPASSPPQQQQHGGPMLPDQAAQQRAAGAAGGGDFSEQFLRMLQRDGNGHLPLGAGRSKGGGKAGSQSTGGARLTLLLPTLGLACQTRPDLLMPARLGQPVLKTAVLPRGAAMHVQCCPCRHRRSDGRPSLRDADASACQASSAP